MPPIVERPEGYYWVSDDVIGEFGPFETYELARVDRDAGVESAPTPGDVAEGLQEVERELGLPDWVDAKGGRPGE